MEKRYPRAQWRGADPANVGGPLEPAKVHLFVLHVMQGTLDGTDSWFHNPRAQVSAHFGIGTDGTVYQFVEIDTMAWHCMEDNDRSIGIEHAGYSGHPITPAALTASLELLEWLHQQFPHVPLRRSRYEFNAGVIAHGELGAAGGGHPDCPGDPILTQFDIALAVLHEEIKKGITKMNINLNLSTVENWLRKVGSYAIFVNDATHTVHVSTSLKAVLTAVAGAIFAVDHYASKPTPKAGA